MGGTWRKPPEPKSEPSRDPDTGTLNEDQLLRKQCLEWAFQTRALCDVPHMHVLNVAQSYYDFIRHTPARQDQEACVEAAKRSLADYETKVLPRRLREICGED